MTEQQNTITNKLLNNISKAHTFTECLDAVSAYKEFLLAVEISKNIKRLEADSELTSRLSLVQVYRENLARVVDPYLTEEDGSDLIPDHIRISNMLERLSQANAIGRSPTTDDATPKHNQPQNDNAQ